jgi:hypothetical protein
MVEDLTPEHLKCDCGASCPSVHRIVIDGKRHLIVVGKEALVYLVADAPGGSRFTELGDVPVGWDERAILIEEDLLSGIGCQAEVTAVGDGSIALRALQSTGSAEAELLAALKEAREDVSSWGAYASEYFRDKWDLAGDLARYDAVIAKHSQRPIEEAGLPADERTAETADASLTSKITPIDVDSMIAEGLKNPEYAMQYVESLREEIASLCASNEKLRAALTKIAKPTVGTELMDTDEEQAEMFWQHIKSFQIIARAALTSPEATETDNG